MAYYAPGTIIPSKLYLIQKESKQHDYFRFLDLPGEIRNKIYDFVFEDCLINVRIGDERQFRRKIISRPLVEFQKTPPERDAKKLQLENRKALNKQSIQNDLRNRSQVDAKLIKQTPMVQDPSPVQQKFSKPQQRGRRSVKQGSPRIYHEVLTALDGIEARHLAGYHVPFNFLFSCRQIYQEALCVMYAKTVFRFTSPKAINRFLLVTPLKALQAIQGLEIFHATHGEPEFTENRKWKILADKKWFTTCKQIRDKMRDLKKLRLDLQLYDWPTQLRLREEWAEPILLLRRNGLHRVDATLSHTAFSEERLKEAAEHLEIAMMSVEGRIAKSAQEQKLLEAKKKKPESKARKVLVIKMDNIPTAQKVQKA